MFFQCHLVHSVCPIKVSVHREKQIPLTQTFGLPVGNIYTLAERLMTASVLHCLWDKPLHSSVQPVFTVLPASGLADNDLGTCMCILIFCGFEN